MQLAISHFEIKARDPERLLEFYTGALGFVVTDRGPPGTYPMIFLSANAGEHHQLVLAAAEAGDFAAGSLDHIAFRVGDLGALRGYHAALEGHGVVTVETVSHGTTWSLYFRDPEGNRLVLFADTPWHIAQPLRFPIDLSMPDDQLIAWTEKQIAELADFQPADAWFREHRARLGDRPG